MRRLQRWILPIVLGLVAVGFLIQYLASGSQPTTWSYSQLITQAQLGKVSTVVIAGNTGVATDQGGRKYNVALPPDQSVTLADELRTNGVAVTFQGTDVGTLLVSFLPNLVILLLVGGLIYWSYRS